MTQLIKGYDQSICNRNRHFKNRNRKFNSACDPSKNCETYCICVQSKQFRIWHFSTQAWSWNAQGLEFVVQRLSSKSGTSFSKNKPLEFNSEPPKPQTLFHPKLHPKVRCILITHKKSSIIGVQSFTFFFEEISPSRYKQVFFI